MKYNDILTALSNKDTIYYQTYLSPVGEIYILGNQHALSAILFKSSLQHTINIDKKLTSKKTDAIKKCLSFLKDYFMDAKNISSYKIILSHNSSVINENINSINLDFTYYTTRELKVYKSLVNVKYGTTISYAALANSAGFPGAARFVGSTMAKNIFPILIPCHRVIKSDNSTGQYSAGQHIKSFLLNHEK